MAPGAHKGGPCRRWFTLVYRRGALHDLATLGVAQGGEGAFLGGRVLGGDQAGA